VGSEGANDLGSFATPILTVDAEVTWSERGANQAAHHPGYDAYAAVLTNLSGARAERARQYFCWCLTQRIQLADPAGLEKEIEACAKLLKTQIAA
jgi:hypothetical protein